ncbi:KTSC domain-containing protein [Klebsiella quasipneumoniae]|uniref:KTSC domain-containing protein n=1 Tax=Klebsiella quasipneumoniae TaxID=1463165 RepID=UPI00237E347E|nr:KTSC domain-containing protein [Klebsiella quasipneumoniae]MDL2152134.1 KTSC domain-containing protein [Klebsiella quasipneumoniae]MDW2824181.1 KTSC domain-containing protein [Klebsiella quasipneumoniae]
MYLTLGAGHDASATLEICFYHQPPLQYTGVPPRIFRDFLQVVSKGRFYDGVGDAANLLI